MALVGVGVGGVDSSAMVEAIVGDNLVGLRSDLRGVMGARVEVDVVSTTIDPDAQFDARIVLTERRTRHGTSQNDFTTSHDKTNTHTRVSLTY